MIVMGKSDPDGTERHRQQSMILVPVATPGVRVLRPLPIFGYLGTLDKASEVVFDDVRVPAGNMLLGEGRRSRLRKPRARLPRLAGTLPGRDPPAAKTRDPAVAEDPGTGRGPRPGHRGC